MRPRRRRSHIRRQAGFIFDLGGGVLVDSGGQVSTTGGSGNGQQQPFSAATENQTSTTEHSQPGHHAIPSADSQLSPSVFSEGLAVSSIPLATTPISIVASVRPTASLTSSSVRSSSLSIHRSSTSSPSASMPVSFSAAFNVSQTSPAASSSSALVAPAGRSVEFYGGITFITIVSLACVISFAAWLIRSRRKGSMCCCGGREDEDVENQDFGNGLGLYLDKSVDGFESQKTPSTPIVDPARSTSQANHTALPAFQGFVNSPGRHPTITMRPQAAHMSTNDSIRTPNQLLGPLQIKNYVSGDFPSSCDEAVLTPKLGREPGARCEQQAVGTPRFHYFEDQGLTVPWAPLNIKSKASSQVNSAYSMSKKSEAAETDGEDELRPLPMPPFEFTQTRREGERGSPDGWGAALRSSIYGALSGVAGSASNSEEDEDVTLTASNSRSDRWRGALSSQRSAGTVIPKSHSNNASRTLMSPSAGGRHGHFDPLDSGTHSADSIGLGLRLAERSTNGVAHCTAPLSLSKMQASSTRSSRHTESAKLRTASRASSVYSPFSRATARSSKRAPKTSKKRRVTVRSSMTARSRPEFLRQPTAGSVTSFSSEASRTMTDEELRAKRTMVLRARRKRGLGVGGSTTRRVTKMSAHSRQSSDAEPPEGRA